jgi:2-methylcitrate dehydratase PrpD
MAAVSDRHATALLDWLACAVRGSAQPAAQAARGAGDGLLERITAIGAAGHVLDFDDTYQPGLAHLSAPTAPAALVAGAQRGSNIADVLAAYAAGFEAMGVLSRACHPALYEGGWHPTAVCGSAGAAVAAARLYELDREQERAAVGLALLRAGGLRAAFGSDGKALQVGMAAATGVHAAALAAAGASVHAGRIGGMEAGFAEAFAVATSAATIDELLDAADAASSDPQAVGENWIKAYPCCLQTHPAIDAAVAVGIPPPADAHITVAVHPLSRRAAALDAVADGLEAKFSIPYLTAYTLAHGAPGLASFDAVDPQAARLAERVSVRTDATLGVAEAVIEVDRAPVARVVAPLGSPANPLDGDALAAKVRALAGDALDGVLDDPEQPAATLLAAIPA